MYARGIKASAAAALAALALLGLASAARAAFPGQNGKIAFGSPQGIETIQPDGSMRTPLHGGDEPAWSPDGTRIAFVRPFGGLAVMNADGSGETTVAPFDVTGPAWSPDGRRIAFARLIETCDPDAGSCEYDDDLYLVDADGTDLVALTNTPSAPESQPAWSPDGATIAFSRNGILETIRPDGTGRTALAPCCTVSPNWSPDGYRIAYAGGPPGGDAEIHTMRADGTNDVTLTDNTVADGAPAWSPDARKIVFHRSSGELFRPGADIWTVNADGAGELKLTTDGHLQDHTNFSPDWQPVPYIGYPRPKGASPMRVSLVPAFARCAAPNRSHGAPLAFGSCAPPAQTSPELTVGTPDANGRQANSVGWATVQVIGFNLATPEDDADVRFRLHITDVRERAGLGDYVGELAARLSVRRTDKDGGLPSTTSDFPFSFPASCAATTDASVGSTCDLITTADTIVPGAVREGVHTIWAIDRLEVYDGGPDADADTPGDTLFATQGVFVQ